MNRFNLILATGLLLAGTGAASAEQVGTGELAEAIEIAELNTYEPGYGSVVTVGMLESRTDRLLERVQIALVVRDDDGEELGRESAQVLLLSPGGWAAFRSVFKEQEYPEWDSLEPLVWRAQAMPGAMAPRLEATIESETPDPLGSSYIHQVRGSITSTDDKALEWTGVDAAFFDADDRLVAVGHDSAATELPPGESAEFSIGINTAGGEVARTEVRGYARPVER